LFPMQQLTNESQLLRGYTVPTSTSSTYTGPIPGAYAASPLQQIAGLGALTAGASNTPLGTSIGTGLSNLGDYLGKLLSSTPTDTNTLQSSLPQNQSMETYNASLNGWFPSGVNSSGQTVYSDESGNQYIYSNGQPVDYNP
jgi:hypothetical protein